eukprot:jgi/Chrzof1/2221/Cz11g07070.t1
MFPVPQHLPEYLHQSQCPPLLLTLASDCSLKKPVTGVLEHTLMANVQELFNLSKSAKRVMSMGQKSCVFCDKMQPVGRVLERCPEVVCIQLVSEAMGARNQQQLADGLSVIDQHLHLSQVYDRVAPGAGKTCYRLSAFTAQYPGHYTA